MKHLPVLILLCSLISASVFAQDDSKVRFGIKTGGNLSMFSASVNSEPSLKPGFHVGIFLRHGTSERFHLRPELYFSSQGEKTNYVTGSGSQSVGKTETTINAINLPVLFEFGRKVTFQVGPQLAMLLSGREKGTIQGQKVDENLKDVMKQGEFGLAFGLGFYPSSNLTLGFRYNVGLSPVFDDPKGAPADFPKFANRVIHISLGFLFSQ